MYKISNYKNDYGDEIISIVRVEDGLGIPVDKANSDYQEYLKWLAAGNTPITEDKVS